MTPAEREGQAIHLAQNTARRMWRPGPHGILYDDIEGAALLGAAKALARYDAAHGVKFSTFAIALIRGEILEEARRWDYLPRGRREEAKRLQAAEGEWPVWAREPMSLEELMEESEGITLVDLIEAPDDVEVEALARLDTPVWLAVIERLPPSVQDIYRARYFGGERWCDISRAWDRSENWAEQMHNAHRPRLREWAEAAGLGG